MRISAAALGLSLAFLAAPALAKPYKGAEVYSQATYTFGRMEMRMRAAKGSGLLSTFFTYKNDSYMPGKSWQEIDIEVFGKNDAKSWQSNIITGTPEKKTMSEQVHTLPVSLADAYHTYVVEWGPNYVAWSLDGQEVRRTADGQALLLKDPQSLRFNLWAAESVAWAGSFDDSVLPVYQYVNWIKYYRYEDGKFVLDWTDEFDTFDAQRWGKGNWTFAENRVDFSPNNAIVLDGTLVLALTHEGQEGFKGTVPKDEGTGGTSTGGTSTGGTGFGGAPATGGSGPTPRPTTPKASGGCALAKASRVDGWSSAALLLGALLLWRRRSA